MKIAYVRVSSIDQNEERQTAALEKYQIEKWYIEKVSGKNIDDRPKLKEMLEFVREGDTVYVMDLSRLARSNRDLLSIVDELERKKVNLVSDKETIDSTTPVGRCMLSMIAAINQLERENILERQREGIAIAKQKGIYKGRTKKKIDDKEFDKNYELYIKREITKKQFAENLRICRNTLDRILKEKTTV